MLNQLICLGTSFPEETSGSRHNQQSSKCLVRIDNYMTSHIYREEGDLLKLEALPNHSK